MNTTSKLRKEIEEIFRNKILFNGTTIPEYFTTDKDKRDKQLYLGIPNDLMNEIFELFLRTIKGILPEKKENLIGYNYYGSADEGFNSCLDEIEKKLDELS